MKNTLIESQYIGTCSYWKVLLQSEAIVIDGEEHFVKRSYRNRAHILGANGLLRLSIPLERGKHQHSKMKDVRISYNEQWQKLHWQSFTSAYRRSAFFEYYEDYFRKFYEEKFEFLIAYNTQFLQTVAKVLKIELSVSFAEQYYKPKTFFGNDYRSKILPSNKGYFENIEPYMQVFNDRFPFEPDLCILDALFNLGNHTQAYLEAIKVKF